MLLIIAIPLTPDSGLGKRQYLITCVRKFSPEYKICGRWSSASFRGAQVTTGRTSAARTQRRRSSEMPCESRRTLHLHATIAVTIFTEWNYFQ